MTSTNNSLNSSRRSLNSSKIKETPPNINIIEGINRYNNSVLTKACVLKGIVKDVSIGPNSSNSENSYLDSNVNESFVTSTPDQTLNGCNIVKNGFRNMFDSELPTSEIFSRDILPDNHKITSSNTTDIKNQLSNSSCYSDETKCFPFESSFSKKQQNKEIVHPLSVRLNTSKINQKVEFLLKEKQRINNELLKMKQDLEIARVTAELEKTKKILKEEEDRASEVNKWKQFNDQRCNQRLNEANERIKNALLKQQEAEECQKLYLKEKKVRLDKIHEYQILYRTAYQKLQEVIKTCKNNKDLFNVLSNEALKLKNTNERFEVIVKKCSSGDVSVQDLNECSNVVQVIENILDAFKKEVESVNLRHENAIKKEEDERLQKELKEKELLEANEKEKQLASVKAENEGVVSSGCFDNEESIKRYLELETFLKTYEKSLQPILEDNSNEAKSFRFTCQKAVNIPVNAISPVSREHMTDKYTKLCRILHGKYTVVPGIPPCGISSQDGANRVRNILGVKFCTNLLAKKLVNQGEQTVSSKPEAAFAIAGIIVSLWLESPDFGTLLLAHFYRECPYLIPKYPSQVEGQSNEDYYKQLGYQYTDGKVESQDKFLKRMSGIMRLYAAIIITQPHIKNMSHPLGIKEGWRWLAATLNLEPMADITATLIFDMLEVAGHDLYIGYRHQFGKMLHILCSDYLNRIEKITPEGCGGPVRRLQTYLEKLLVNAMPPFPPEGRLDAKIW